MSNPERLTYTVAEVAKVLGISMPTAYDLTESEGFPVIRIGRKKLVPKKELEEWLTAQVPR